MTIKEKIVKAPKGRVSRRSLGANQKFRFKGLDTENFHYRVANDVDDRIEHLKDLGYELVDSEAIEGNGVDSASSVGGKTNVAVGNGIRGKLMRIPKDEFELAQREKNQALDEAEAQMKNQTTLEGNYGKIEFTREHKRS